MTCGVHVKGLEVNPAAPFIFFSPRVALIRSVLTGCNGEPMTSRGADVAVILASIIPLSLAQGGRKPQPCHDFVGTRQIRRKKKRPKREGRKKNLFSSSRDLVYDKHGFVAVSSLGIVHISHMERGKTACR